MEVVTGLALLLKLGQGIRNAVEAGSNEVSDEDLDEAVAAIPASDNRLSDAIARARARETES